MSKTATINKSVIKTMIEQDALLAFRYKALIELEKNEPNEAIKALFSELIADDDFRLSQYRNLIKKQSVK